MNITIELPGNVKKLISLLENSGHEAYAVGGCVRDALLGTVPNDWDLTTSASPDEVKAALEGLRILDTGLKHGTVSAVLDNVYEITTFRIDGEYSDSRHPDSVSFSKKLEDDLSRRDFTINAMAYNEKRGLVDVFKGADDLQNHVIKCVGDPDKRMDEDALRILRAARFQSKLGFSIEQNTKQAILRHIRQLNFVSKERIGSEFRQLVSAPFAAKAIRENRELVFSVAPELENSQSSVFEQTLKILEHANYNDCAFPAGWADENVRIAILFLYTGGSCDETGFSEKSGVITKQIMKRLKYSNELASNVSELVSLQDVPLPPERPYAKRLMARMSPVQLKRLLKLKECVIRALYGKDSEHLRNTIKFYGIVQQLQDERAAIHIKELNVSGDELIKSGLKPGIQMGRILNTLLEEVIDETLQNEKNILLERARMLNDKHE